MNNLVEQYVQTVAQQLPVKEREETYKELTANIYGMLPEDAGENEIKETLTNLGSPITLAEQYRQKPDFIISPAFYSDYMAALKRFLPIITGIFIIIGLVLAEMSVMNNQPRTWSSDPAFNDPSYRTENFWIDVAIKIVLFGFPFGLTGLVLSFGFITLVFYLADKKDKKQTDSWKIENLSKTAFALDNQIPLKNIAIGFLSGTLLCFLSVLYCGGGLPQSFMNKISSVAAYTVSESPYFVAYCTHTIVIMAAFTILKYTIQLTKRHWTPLVCAFSVLGSLVNMRGALFLIYESFIFNEEIFLSKSELIYNNPAKIINTVSGNLLLFTIIAVIVIAHIASAVAALHKTIKYNTVRAQ